MPREVGVVGLVQILKNDRRQQNHVEVTEIVLLLRRAFTHQAVVLVSFYDAICRIEREDLREHLCRILMPHAQK